MNQAAESQEPSGFVEAEAIQVLIQRRPAG